MEGLIKQILLIEWDMFKSVSNVGGEAECQQNKKTFIIMRRSQIMSLAEDVLKSYFEDLENAKIHGRNIMTEKYARMMEYTFPQEFKELENKLPKISNEVKTIVDKITVLTVAWAMQMKIKYPNVIGAGRSIYSMEDSIENTSIETYCRGELLTYGIKTLNLMWQYYSKCLLDEINCYELVLKNMVKFYGYESIEEANNKKNFKN